MSPYDSNESMEYAALMARSRDAERTWQMCWTASGLVAGVTLSWAIAARHPGLFLPVILSAACGFYAMLQGRREVRMIAAYIEEFHEDANGPQWFSRLTNAAGVPGFSPTGEWLMTCVTNAAVMIATVFAWLGSPSVPRGELMSGLVTGCAVVFLFHSLSETAQLQRTNYSAIWRQAGQGLSEVKRGRRAA